MVILLDEVGSQHGSLRCPNPRSPRRSPQSVQPLVVLVAAGSDDRLRRDQQDRTTHVSRSRGSSPIAESNPYNESIRLSKDRVIRITNPWPDRRNSQANSCAEPHPERLWPPHRFRHAGPQIGCRPHEFKDSIRDKQNPHPLAACSHSRCCCRRCLLSSGSTRR